MTMTTKFCDQKYSAGMMRDRIVIEKKTLVADGIGGYTETWVADPPNGVPCIWKPVVGIYQFNAETTVGQRLVEFNRFRAVIRFRGDSYGAPYYTAGDRVLHKGRYYAIESAIDPDGLMDWIELALVEGKSS
ncbi:head-tail adaptor protein [Candidatus Parcubacteria bacterium]|nr:MAG: head-tail adaptor protein [Candidatus Parcubacteria bacterium]